MARGGNPGGGGGGGNGNGGGGPKVRGDFAANLRHYWTLWEGGIFSGGGEGWIRNYGQVMFPAQAHTSQALAQPLALRRKSVMGAFLDAGHYIRAQTPTTVGENLGTRMTIGVWVRPDSAAIFKCLVMKSDGFAAGPCNFGLDLSNSAASPVPRFYFTVAGVFKTLTSTTAIPLIFPATLIVGTYDGITQRLFVNGQAAGTRAETGTPDASIVGDIGIGATTATIIEGILSGHVALAFIFNRALTEGEILRLAQDGPPAFEIPDVLLPGLGSPLSGAGGARVFVPTSFVSPATVV